MTSQSSTYALDRQMLEGCQMLSTQPQVGIQASDPLNPSSGGGQRQPPTWEPQGHTL